LLTAFAGAGLATAALAAAGLAVAFAVDFGAALGLEAADAFAPVLDVLDLDGTLAMYSPTPRMNVTRDAAPTMQSIRDDSDV
jgi:hypothetical protein